MKKYFKSIMLLAAAAMAFTACNKEVESQEPEKVNGMTNVRFSAVVDEAETRATLTTEDELTFTAAWEEGDLMDIEARVINTDAVEYEEAGSAMWMGTYFETDLPDCEYRGEWTYSAYYPLKESNLFGNARVQNGNNYNSEYDIMKGDVTYDDAYLGQDNNGGRMVVPMSRLTSILYFHLTSDLNEALASATLTVEGGDIAAELVSINNGALEAGLNETNTITITFAEGTAPTADDFRLWFNILPVQATGLTLNITTASGKTATLSNTRGKIYAAGKLNKIVKSGLTWEEGEMVAGPSYVWVLKSGDLGVTGSPSSSIEKGTPLMTWAAEYTWGEGAAKYFGYDTNLGRGVQIGKGSEADKCVSAVFSTSDYTGYIEKVRINFSHASSGGSSATVKIGNVNLTCGGETSVNGTTSAADYMFVSNQLVKGDVVITLSNSAPKALYLKSIEINPDLRETQTLSFPESSYSVELSEGTFASPTLSGAETSVTYDSENKEVATVDDNGLVTLLSTGTTTITAIAAESELYQEGRASYTLTVNPGPSSIADVIAAANNASVYTQGIVAQVNAKGFIITDGTNNLLVYPNATPSVVVGQSVKVSGTRGTYNNIPQITSPTITPGATGQSVTRTPLTTITGTNATGFTSSEYVSLTGILTISNSFYNISIEGSSTKGSLYQVVSSATYTAGSLADLDGKGIIVTGYVAGSTSNYLNIAPVDIILDPNSPEISISPATSSSDPASWPADNDEEKTFTVSATNGTWAITDASTVSGWATISPNGDVITVTPKEKQATEAHSGSIVITLTPSHDGYENKTATIYLSQAKYSTGGTTYTKVTSAPSDWSGTYLIVYESASNSGNVCLAGTDDYHNWTEATIASGVITSNDLSNYEVEIATYSTGYSIKALGGANANKYIEGKGSSSNGTNFPSSPSKVTTLSISNGVVTITNNTNLFVYNSTSGSNGERWRFYKSGTAAGNNYMKPALYKKN